MLNLNGALLLLPSEAVMVVSPILMPVATPFALTPAILGLLEIHCKLELLIVFPVESLTVNTTEALTRTCELEVLKLRVLAGGSGQAVSTSMRVDKSQVKRCIINLLWLGIDDLECCISS